MLEANLIFLWDAFVMLGSLAPHLLVQTE